jgi:hypothetical protein
MFVSGISIQTGDKFVGNGAREHLSIPEATLLEKMTATVIK